MSYVRLDIGVGERSWDTGDCTTRSLAIVLGISYKSAYRLLYELQGEHQACAFRLTDFLRRSPGRLGVVRYIPFKAQKGKPRMTGQVFCKSFPVGRFILKQAHHTAAVVNGVLYDRWDSSNRCVYGAWEIRKSA